MQLKAAVQSHHAQLEQVTGELIRFDAFPYQRFGLFEEEASQPSRSIVLPGEIKMPVTIHEPVYGVDATLAIQEIRAYGESCSYRLECS